MFKFLVLSLLSLTALAQSSMDVPTTFDPSQGTSQWSMENESAPEAVEMPMDHHDEALREPSSEDFVDEPAPVEHHEE